MKNRKRVVRLIFIVALINLFPAVLYSDDVSLGTVIVNADRESNAQEGSSGFSSVVKKERVNIKSQDVPTLIEKETSIQVRQSGGLGSYSSVSLRGASSDQVMVLLNGVPLNDAAESSVDLSTIPSSDIESIEIYRGVTPASFGRASIGGAININTVHAKKELKANIVTSYSSFNTFKFAPTISQKPGKFDYMISGEYSSSKNNFTFLNDNSTPLNPSDDNWEARNHDQFSQKNMLLETGYDFSKDIRLVFFDQYFNKGQNLPNWNNSPLVTTNFSTTRNMSSLKFNINNIGVNHFNTSSRLDYIYKSEYYDDRDGTFGLGKQYNRYKTDNYGFNQLFEWPTQYNVLDAVLDIHREEFRTTDLLYNNYYAPRERNMYSLSAEDKVLMFSDRLIVNPAMFYEYYDDVKAGHLNPKLGIKYSINNLVSLKTNIAQYTREPSFFELYGDRGIFKGSSDLKAERGINFDIGPEVNYNNEGSDLSRVSFNLAYFSSNIKDVISYVYDSMGIGHAVNISNSTINGIESSLIVDFLKHFSLNSNYTWQRPVNHSSVAMYDGRELPGRFQYSFNSRLEAKCSFIRPYYEFSYQSGLFYDTANLLPAPIKREHNAGVSGIINDLVITAEVKNIGDDHYEDFNGYPTPGRSYWMTLRYDI